MRLLLWPLAAVASRLRPTLLLSRPKLLTLLLPTPLLLTLLRPTLLPLLTLLRPTPLLLTLLLLRLTLLRPTLLRLTPLRPTLLRLTALLPSKLLQSTLREAAQSGGLSFLSPGPSPLTYAVESPPSASYDRYERETASLAFRRFR